MRAFRLLVVGGLISYRALFSWLSPWIFIPSMLVGPIFQILLFANIGRAANIADDEFYLIGNAIQYTAIPCLFGMANTIASERFTNTLGIVLASPARRIPLFLGRSLPVIVNGLVVSAFGLSVGALLLGVRIPASTWPKIILILVIASASCTGLGMVVAAYSLRVRETAVLSNIVFGILLVFSGANLPPTSLPDWMLRLGDVLPLTHAIASARRVAAGSSISDVAGPLATEAAIGVAYLLFGMLMLNFLERTSRRTASLERS